MARRKKKDFCLKCDTADRKKIGKGKICKVCESELAVNPYFGTWEPYTKLRPFGEFRLAFIVFLPLFFYGFFPIANDILAGDVSCEGTACGNPIVDGLFLIIVWGLITGFLSWSMGAGLLSNLVYNHPGWAWLECPECGYKGKKGQGTGGGENFGQFLWNRVMPATCPKCKLKFEIENMSQWGWPYDDEPFEGEIYGDQTKIRVKPEIPFRFLKFIIRKNDYFDSNHYELIKVIPILAITIGTAWFLGMLDLVILLSIVVIAVYIFVWDHVLFKPIRDFYDDMLDEVFDVKESHTFLPNTPLRKAALAFTFVLTCILALLFLPGGIIENSDHPWIRAIGELIWWIIIFILELIFYSEN